MPALKPLPATLALAAILVLGSTAALLYTGTSRAADEAPADTARPALTVSTAQPQRGAVPLRCTRACQARLPSGRPKSTRSRRWSKASSRAGACTTSQA